MPYRLPPHPQLIAHRGNAGPSPENTRLAIEQAIAVGVDMVEVDVRLSREGVPVLIHNATLEQTTSGSGPVDRHTLSQLKRLDAGGWKGAQFAGEPLLTLNEALELARSRVALNLDLKTPQAIGTTLKSVRDMGMANQVVISGCTWLPVRSIRASNPEVTVLLNVSKSLDFLARRGHAALFRVAYLAQARTAAAAGINVNHLYIDRDLIAAAHLAGLTVWTWTVDDGQRLRELADLGVDAITTNWPEVMIQVMERPKS